MSGAVAGFREEISAAPNESRPVLRPGGSRVARSRRRPESFNREGQTPFVGGGDGAAVGGTTGGGLCRPPRALARRLEGGAVDAVAAGCRCWF